MIQNPQHKSPSDPGTTLTRSRFSVRTNSVRLSQSPTASGNWVSLFWSTFKIDSFFSFPVKALFKLVSYHCLPDHRLVFPIGCPCSFDFLTQLFRLWNCTILISTTNSWELKSSVQNVRNSQQLAANPLESHYLKICQSPEISGKKKTAGSWWIFKNKKCLVYRGEPLMLL